MARSAQQMKHEKNPENFVQNVAQFLAQFLNICRRNFDLGNVRRKKRGVTKRGVTQKSWKSRFWYRYRPEGIFRIFFSLILAPSPRYLCFYSEKKANSLVLAIFSPLHGLFRKRGWYRSMFFFSLKSSKVDKTQLF